MSISLHVGDLCGFSGTIGWGDVCMIIKIDEDPFKRVTVYRQDGTIAMISPRFLLRISDD